MYNGEKLTIKDGQFRFDNIEIYGWHYIALVDTESNVRMQFLKNGMLALSNTLDEELIKQAQSAVERHLAELNSRIEKDVVAFRIRED